jgi:hypothetical protein
LFVGGGGGGGWLLGRLLLMSVWLVGSEGFGLVNQAGVPHQQQQQQQQQLQHEAGAMP